MKNILFIHFDCMRISKLCSRETKEKSEAIKNHSVAVHITDG